jgi:uncharacterized protein (TIGR03435 family)
MGWCTQTSRAMEPSCVTGVYYPAMLATRFVAVVLLAAAGVRAEVPQRIQFDVASVKLNSSGPEQPPFLDGTTFRANGQVRITNMSLWTMIQLIYLDDRTMLMEGGPSWIDDDRFDIVAKGEPASDAQAPMGRIPPRLNAMLHALFEDRFKLRLHVEQREIPVYALVPLDRANPAKKLKPGNYDCLKPPEQRIRECTYLPRFLASPAMTMDDLAARLSTVLNMANAGFNKRADIGRPVDNRTGIEGRFDIDLDPVGSVPPPERTAAIITAMREQLGLTVENARAGRNVLVIDAAEHPRPD